MNFRPSTAFGSVRERMMTITSITNSAGMPTLLNFSMPLSTPPCTMTMQRIMKKTVKTTAPKGCVRIAVKAAEPEMAICSPPKLSSERFSAMYCMT